MRVGVYGLGRIGVMHARNLAQDPDVDEVVLIGRDDARLQSAHAAVQAALRPDLHANTGGHRLQQARPAAVSSTLEPLGSVLPTLDGIVVATSTVTHSALALEVAESGTPLLIEKPLCLSADSLRDLSDRLDETGTPVMVAFHRRYDPAYQALRGRVASGEIGAVRVARSTNHDHSALPLDFIPQSRGIWIDLLIHDFDITPWVIGQEAVAVQAFGSVIDEPEYARHGDADTAVAILEFASGAIATISGTRRNGAGQDCRLEIFGSDGTIAAGVDDHTPVTSTEPGARRPVSPYTDYQARFDVAFRRETASFISMIKDETESQTPPRAGLAATTIAEAAHRSFSTGDRVTIDYA